MRLLSKEFLTEKFQQRKRPLQFRSGISKCFSCSLDRKGSGAPFLHIQVEIVLKRFRIF